MKRPPRKPVLTPAEQAAYDHAAIEAFGEFAIPNLIGAPA